MDSSNHWYHHAHILAEYCGLDREAPPRINGILQHGWTFVHGFGYGHKPPAGFPRLVWSDVCRRRGHSIGWRDYVVIGAPFLYLMASNPATEPAPEREGTIWYPFHGTADYETVTGNHHALIEEIKAVEDGPVTVCLYYVEYDQPEINKVYTDAGFRVICHGTRGSKWRGGNSDFLLNQLTEVRRHRRVVSNRLSTAIFHGVAAGCEAAVYGDPMEFVGGRPGFVDEGLIPANYPEFFDTHPDQAAVRATVDREMGVAEMMSPEELRVALGWSNL
ncbi:hypothetical protein [Microlunatus sp. Y2014]|uniref:hypothetical protein n=1 Tax=Microlunatus sp. Y2014 TaxID=3418488 RepID=UPI003DA7A5E1